MKKDKFRVYSQSPNLSSVILLVKAREKNRKGSKVKSD